MICCSQRYDFIEFTPHIFTLIHFIAFADKVIEKTEKEKTKEWYRTSINALIWFYGRNKIDIRDITAQRINELKDQLAIKGQNGRPLQPGAISNYLRGIRAIFNKARDFYNNVDYDIIRVPNDPFSSKVKIPKYRRSRKSLSVEDIIRIRDGQFSTERANMARDVFMIMFYMMGINVKDLYSIKKVVRGVWSMNEVRRRLRIISIDFHCQSG